MRTTLYERISGRVTCGNHSYREIGEFLMVRFVVVCRIAVVWFWQTAEQ